MWYYIAGCFLLGMGLFLYCISGAAEVDEFGNYIPKSIREQDKIYH